MQITTLATRAGIQQPIKIDAYSQQLEPVRRNQLNLEILRYWWRTFAKRRVGAVENAAHSLATNALSQDISVIGIMDASRCCGGMLVIVRSAA